MFPSQGKANGLYQNPLRSQFQSEKAIKARLGICVNQDQRQRGRIGCKNGLPVDQIGRSLKRVIGALGSLRGQCDFLAGDGKGTDGWRRERIDDHVEAIGRAQSGRAIINHLNHN